MMYARPQLADAHSRLWKLIRLRLSEVGIDSPSALSQDAEEFGVWLNPQLVLSQTCGMPYRLALHRNVKLVGTPDYGLIDCPAGYYRSALVVRTDDPRNDLIEFQPSILAFNEPFSQSGYASVYWHAKQRGFWFSNTLKTGQHLASAFAVAKGTASIASLDAVTWRMIQQYESIAEQLRVLEWTKPTPGLPLITSLKHDEGDIHAAVCRAIDDLSEEDQALLGINGLVKIPACDYLAIANPDLPECVVPL